VTKEAVARPVRLQLRLKVSIVWDA
jgi:hypothetical protein